MIMHEDSMKILYLVGLKHSGKSRLGRFTSVALGTSFRVAYADTDDLILKTLRGTGLSVREYYRQEGKGAFMLREHEVVQHYVEEIQHQDHELAIISMGGGVCDNESLVRLMQETGTLLYLSVSKEILFERIMEGGVPPFLSDEDPKGSFDDMYDSRNARYRQISDYMVRLSDYQTVAENGQTLTHAILNLLGRGTSCQETVLERLYR